MENIVSLDCLSSNNVSCQIVHILIAINRVLSVKKAEYRFTADLNRSFRGNTIISFNDSWVICARCISENGFILSEIYEKKIWLDNYSGIICNQTGDDAIDLLTKILKEEQNG